MAVRTKSKSKTLSGGKSKLQTSLKTTVNVASDEYFSCYAPSEDTTWTYYPDYETVYCKGVYFVGPFSQGGYISTNYSTADIHQGIVVEFTVAFFDSWMNNNFTVTADGTVVYSFNWDYQFSMSDLCEGNAPDSSHLIQFGYNHSGDSTYLVFSSDIANDTDASWGICGLTITTTDNPVLSTGLELSAIKEMTFGCDSPAMDADWTYYPSYSTISCEGGTYVGAFSANGSMLSSNLSVPSEHKGIIVTFKVALIDYWQNQTLTVLADGVEVYSLTYDDSYSEKDSCLNSWADYYKTVRFGFNHTAQFIQFEITSNIDESDDAAWGICDFTVETTARTVYASGFILGGSTKPYTFICASPAEDSYWVYNPDYRVTYCNGNYYVGPYGAGATLSTTLAVAEAHLGIAISFNLALFDAWDNNRLIIMADGEVVYTHQHQFLDSTTDSCQNAWPDLYTAVKFGFNHSASTVQIVITSDLTGSLEDESWGLCMLSIVPLAGYADANGNMIGLSKDLTFSCQTPAFDPDWSYTPSFQTVDCAGSTYVGGYGAGQSLNTTQHFISLHRGIVMYFKLALFDAWDNQTFYVNADGETVYSLTHSYLNSSSDTCASAWADKYFDVSFGFNHSLRSLRLTFYSDLDQDSSEASWGICNLVIKATQEVVDAAGNELGAIKKQAFSCSSPAADLEWTYFPAYSTINCSGSYFLGGYSHSGKVFSSLRVPTPHKGIVLSFQLALINSWEDKIFTVSADGKLVYWTNQNKDINSTNTCNHGWDSQFINVRVGFNHSDEAVLIVFSSTITEGDEAAWGICDVSLVAVDNFVDRAGNEYGAVKALTFECLFPSKDVDWTYTPNYTTTTCGSNTYVSGFSSGGRLTSSLNVPSFHQGLVVSFKLALFDEWDGDTFIVYADGTPVFSEIFNATSVKSKSECVEKVLDVKFGFNHTSEGVSFIFTSDINQDSDASWGLCDLAIEISADLVDAEGNAV